MSSASPPRKSEKLSSAASNRKTSSLSSSARDNKGPVTTVRGAGQLRIIGGAWRRRTLSVAQVDGLRPTSDRVRETLFNWLGQTLDGLSVLDVFAGTGALGLESASRGAAKVVMLEKHPVANRVLSEHAKALQVSSPLNVALDVVKADALTWLQVDTRRAWADVIFLDPPFRSELLKQSLPHALLHLAPGGVMYVEWHESLTDQHNTSDAEWLKGLGLEVFRQDKAGQVHYHLLRRQSVDLQGQDS